MRYPEPNGPIRGAVTLRPRSRYVKPPLIDGLPHTHTLRPRLHGDENGKTHRSNANATAKNLPSPHNIHRIVSSSTRRLRLHPNAGSCSTYAEPVRGAVTSSTKAATSSTKAAKKNGCHGCTSVYSPRWGPREPRRVFRRSTCVKV